MDIRDDRFDHWIAALQTRHLSDLRFPEVSRALRALSSTYVERRQTLTDGAALAGAGKRAAFALFYGPLHYLLVAHIVRSIPEATQPAVPALVDLGCGTGASGAAWASAIVSTSVPVTNPRIVAVVARSLEQRVRRLDCPRCMVGAGEAWDEECDDLVADELVDDAVMGDEDAHGDVIESGQEASGMPSA